MSALAETGFAPRARVLRRANPELYAWLQQKFRYQRVEAQRKRRRARRRAG